MMLIENKVGAGYSFMYDHRHQFVGQKIAFYFACRVLDIMY